MTQSDDRSKGPADPMEGAAANPSLPDVIAQSVEFHFSGCLTVRYEDQVGRIFFRAGEIVHAEQGSASGSDAFYDILVWPGPLTLSLEAKVAASRRTIRARAAELLAEARQTRAVHGPAESEQTDVEAGGEARSSMSLLLEKLRGVPGVAYVVLMSKDGTCVEDESFQAEALAGQASYLSMVANHLGTIFQAGPVLSASIHGSNQHMLLMASKNYYLSVLVQATAEVRAVEAEIRRTLTPVR
jgi:predicted regulator of Ras-like GTPase activity (Roadblock/LC7/MglB family)